MAAPGTTVIVVSYKIHPWLEPCLASIAGQADEVVVVDNGSPDGAASATARRFDATAVRLPANQGFAGGVNAGLSAAHGDIVALLNDDAVAGPDWLASAARVLEDPSVAAVGPKMVLPGRYAALPMNDSVFHAPGDPRPLGRMITEASVDGEDVLDRIVGDLHGLENGPDGHEPARWRWTRGPGAIYVPLPDGATEAVVNIDGERVRAEGPPVTLLNSAGTAITEEGEAQDYGSELPDDGRFDQVEERFSACGGAMAVRADTLRKVGHFAGHFFAYYEDVDWCWRARLAGYRIVYDPASTITHVRWATSGGPAGSAIWPLLKRNRVLSLVRNAPARVAARQLHRAWSENWPPGLRRDLVATVPAAAVQRRRLARRWTVSPGEVWSTWAGRHTRSAG